jgi:ubiquinol-cytochrome c reductase cytochrome c subunit
VWVVAPVAFGVVVALFLVLPSASAVEVPPPHYSGGGDLGPLPEKDIPKSQDVAHVYRRDCATCHGADGRGTQRAPSLEGVGRASVYYWVSTGRMPLPDLHTKIARRPPRYSAGLTSQLVDFVVGLAGGGGPDIPTIARGDLSHGQRLFNLECASCHAWSGEGSIIFNGDVPAVQPANAKQIASAIRTGPGTMPAFGTAAFDQNDLNDVVTYVRSLDHVRDAGGNPLWHRGPTTEGGTALVFGLGAVLLAIGWIGGKARLRANP